MRLEGVEPVFNYFFGHSAFKKLLNTLSISQSVRVSGLAGSSGAFLAATLKEKYPRQVHILESHEVAAHFFNDMENVGWESASFFPSSFGPRLKDKEKDRGMVMLRTKALEEVENNDSWSLVCSPEGFAEAVVSEDILKKSRIEIPKGEIISQDFLVDWLREGGFFEEENVLQPGQFALRGALVDVFSYGSEWPYRIVFDDER